MIRARFEPLERYPLCVGVAYGNGTARVVSALTQPLPEPPNCCRESAALFWEEMRAVDSLKGPSMAMLRYLVMCVAE